MQIKGGSEEIKIVLPWQIIVQVDLCTVGEIIN